MNKLMEIFVPVSSKFSIFPDLASDYANINYTFFILNVFLYSFIFFLIFFLLFYYCFLNKQQVSNNDFFYNNNINKKLKKLEYFLMVIFFFFVLILNFNSLKIFVSARYPFSDSKEIKVIGQKWNWDFNLNFENISLSGPGVVIGVKKDESLKFILTSQDVIHSFWLPNFSLKQDLIPNRYTEFNIKPNIIGEFPILCAEFCGEKHSDMLAILKVMTDDDFLKWKDDVKNSSSNKTFKELGEELYNKKGCVACHSIDGTIKIGPSFKKLYGKTEQLEGGGSVLVTDEYIRQSILEPQKQITKGFLPVMPSFQGQLSEKEIINLIEFIKFLS